MKLHRTTMSKRRGQAGVGAPSGGDQGGPASDCAAADAAPPAARLDSASAPAGGEAGPAADIVLRVTLIRGGLSNVETAVAVCAHYKGLALGGPAKAFDERLDSLLTHACELGMIGLDLGQLFPLNLERERKAGKVNAGCLLVAGMGEPGRFATDGLRYLMSNITVALKAMGHDLFATTLFGTRRDELPAGVAVRAFLTGIRDGFERLRAIAKPGGNKDSVRLAAMTPLTVLLVVADDQKLGQIESALRAVKDRNSIQGLQLSVDRGPNVERDETGHDAAHPNETVPDAPLTYLRIALKGDAPSAARASTTRKIGGASEIFEFSALSDLSAVSVREADISSYLLQRLPARIIARCSADAREELCGFFGEIVIPEDFRKLAQKADNLTLEVDECTAAYPWEMIADRGYAATPYLGANVGVSRQFKSLLSPPPTSPPPLNTSLNILIVADPAPGRYSLPHARLEGYSVLQALDRARRAWGVKYDIKATVRIGSRADAAAKSDLQAILDKLPGHADWVCFDLCDPLEIALRVVKDEFDVIHYAGHGFADAATGQSGWVLDEEYLLSAKEIFRVRQVPRLVFANACFSADVAGDPDTPLAESEQRKRLVGMAHAFFARGIPNFIGAGWKVDDDCARRFAECFYARVLGLGRPDETGAAEIETAPDTISAALREARLGAMAFDSSSSTWGAYQHYGRIAERLLPPIADAPAARRRKAPPPSQQSQPSPLPPAQESEAGGASPIATGSAPALFNSAMGTSAASPTPASASGGGNASRAPDPNLVYVNGINPETGALAVPPLAINALANGVRRFPGVTAVRELSVDTTRFALPYNVDFSKLEETGWGIVFPEDAPQDVRTALAGLMAARQGRAKERFKELSYKKGEQTRDWYLRYGIAVGEGDPEIVPYYLLLVGPPDQIPFDFQYLLGIEYAVGRLSFDTAAEYGRYAESILAYEGAQSAPSAKEIVYWGTHHFNDPATDLSSSLLVDPLASGIPGARGALKTPLGAELHCDQKLYLGDDATKDALLGTLHAGKPPAVLFTASHGMAVNPGSANQAAVQGALLCQDWPGFGRVKANHIVAATDVADDANVGGLIAFLFACYGAGTPDIDQFPPDLAKAAQLPPPAAKPFISALPRRLLTHPNGGALAVIGHIDRAWGFSIQGPNATGPQIMTFRSGLGSILVGEPVGHALTKQFGQRFAALSATLLSAISPTASSAGGATDKEIVAYWIERNDAQNYIILGDPAARIRDDVLA